MALYCDGSGQLVYAAVNSTKCPVCGAIVKVTSRRHMVQHLRPRVERAGARSR